MTAIMGLLHSTSQSTFDGLPPTTAADRHYRMNWLMPTGTSWQSYT